MEIDIVGSRDGCGKACPNFLTFWTRFWERWASDAEPPTALITCADYRMQLRQKSRAMLNAAERRYTFRQIAFNDHLAGFEAVNRSRPVTSEGPMRGWYVQPVTRDCCGPVRDLCDLHREVWYGGFDAEGALLGYARIFYMNRLGVVHDLLGAAGATAIVNGLVAHIAQEGLADHVSYHVLDAGSAGRRAFKERIGCREVRLRLCTRPATTG